MKNLSFLLFTILLTTGCNQYQEEVPEISPVNSRFDYENVESYPVILFDRASALSLAADCDAGMLSYFCEAVPEILEFTLEGTAFSVPVRPRHCPSISCAMNGDTWGTAPKGGSVPGTVCVPKVCGELLGGKCLEDLSGLLLGVRSSSPEETAGYLLHKGKVVASTTEEHGGSILQGMECNTVTLDFGRPLEDLLITGMEIRIRTIVDINGESVPTEFKARF